MNKKLKIISFEGADGCGKTTQIQLTQEYLNKEGIPAKVIKEPGGTKIGQEIRKMLLKEQTPKVCPKAQIFLFIASQIQSLEENKNFEGILLFDRYRLSTLIYQGILPTKNKKEEKENLELIIALQENAELPTEDLCISFELDYHKRKERMQKRSKEKNLELNHFDLLEEEYQKKLDEAFAKPFALDNLEKEYKQKPKIKIIKANKNIENIQKSIQCIIKTIL